ncbi:hypothetical protein GVN99_15460 [Serratia marcescens]|uniref:hypothetical protein n=1 Tax=Serratia TaxID=613 RepID=UPI001571C3A4|nr:hypothetical protein [Serratia marcescens]NSM20511.1 hypothetical protein [Serratia marcescens]NSM47770.1 hypothetical protein [Serratia marcescens]
MSEITRVDALAYEFFKCFSTAEYALKASGFFDKNANHAQADWDAFAREQKIIDLVGADFLNRPVRYILDNPPNKQVIDNDTLSWSVSEPQNKPECEKIFIYIRRVRNNLFHGGKLFRGGWLEPQRSVSLMMASIEIIEAAMNELDAVKIVYREAAKLPSEDGPQ